MSTNDLERADQRKALDEFANAGAQPNQPSPHGHALVRPTSGLAERVIGAQPVAVQRDEQKILQKIKALAAMAGPDWFYRFPVRTQSGGQDWIEGPSIKLANNVARIYGNNINEVRELDVGDAWVFYARFTDIENGFSMERAYHQRKSQSSMKTKDRDRQLDIAYQIGQSKAIRNAIVNGLDLYCGFAFDEARNSLVEKIGKDLEGWRKRTIDGIARMPCDIKRVERVIGRASREWLAPDVARIIAMMQSVADGMATVDDCFPLETAGDKPATDLPTAAAPSDEPDATDSPTSTEAERPPTEAADGEAGGAAPHKPTATSAEPISKPTTFDGYIAMVRDKAVHTTDRDQLRAWFVSDQQRQLRNKIGMVAEQTNEARAIIEARAKQL
jgi:hypothetical protein